MCARVNFSILCDQITDTSIYERCEFYKVLQIDNSIVSKLSG